MVEACIVLPVNPGAQLFPFLYSVWFNCGGGGGGRNLACENISGGVQSDCRVFKKNNFPTLLQGLSLSVVHMALDA